MPSIHSKLDRRAGRLRPASGRGFTIIELTIVCALVAIMAAVAVPRWNRATERAAVTSCQRVFEADMGALRRHCSRQSRVINLAITPGTSLVTLTPPLPELIGNSAGTIDYARYCPGIRFTGVDFNGGTSCRIDIFGELQSATTSTRLQAASVTLNLHSTSRVTDLLFVGGNPLASTSGGGTP